jgi:hypothetical protein
MERVYADPINLADVREMERAGGWCLEANRVTYRRSYLAMDGRQLTCVFDAPDAESLRRAVRQLGVEVAAIWAGTRHVAVEDQRDALRDRSLVVVERCFDEPVVLSDLQAVEDAAAWCLEAHHVQFLHTYFALDRLRMLCLYAAPDAEAVRRAQSTAQMPFDRAWSATLYLPAGSVMGSER